MSVLILKEILIIPVENLQDAYLCEKLGEIFRTWKHIEENINRIVYSVANFTAQLTTSAKN